MAKRPHIIIFNPDEMRGDALAHLGNPASITPNLDAFAANEAVSFRQAYCQNPVCVPSRCSFFTGLYPHVRGHRTMSHLLRPGETSMLKELKEAGYYVWMNDRNDLTAGQIPGWTESHATEIYYSGQKKQGPGNVNPDQRGEPGNKYYYSHYEGQLKCNAEGKNYNGDDEVVDAAIERIHNRPADQPLCMFLGLVYPHTPYRVEEPYFSAIDRAKLPKRVHADDCTGKPLMEAEIRKYAGMQDFTDADWDELRAVYLGMCMKIDVQFGKLVEALKEEGIYDDCAIFFLSDHGDFTGDFDLPEKAQNCFEDCLTRVPLLIKPPKNIPLDPGISNSMVELYTMQKYLQYGTLKEKNLLHFDAWASTFGETVTAIELAPEGTGYRAKTRFARFYNLPELMSLFKQTADIQTADMLKLPVPKANYHNVVLKPSAYQVEMVKDLSERAERVRNRMVDSSVDNMLLITNDGRKLALDQRLMNPMLPDDENGKVSACAKNVFEIWQKTAEQKSTQMVFCDLSTPHNDGNVNVYDGIRDKLLDMGIPKDQIAYIHNAASEAQKKELFGKVRSGEIRVLIGSTQKMGAGTNVQKKLIALHHVDCPWRPSDLQQREGRIIRQGNENPEVEIYTYVTENTFDSYLYQMVEGKQKFIGQVMTSKAPARSAEDIDETALSYAEVKALCTGNPYIKEKMDLDIAVQRLKMLKASHLSQRYALEDKIAKVFPDQIAALEQKISGYKSDIELREAQTMPNEDGFSSMEVEGTAYIEKKAAGSALLAAAHNMTSPDAIPIGMYRGFAMVLSFDTFAKEYRLNLKGQLSHPISLGTDLFGNIQRIDNMLAGLESDLRQCEAQLDNARVQLSNAKAAVDKPFPQEDELKTKLARLDELNILLNLDKRENEIVDGEPDESEPKEKKRDMER